MKQLLILSHTRGVINKFAAPTGSLQDRRRLTLTLKIKAQESQHHREYIQVDRQNDQDFQDL